MLKLIFACVLGIGFVALIGYFVDNGDVSRSADWPSTNATLIEVLDKGIGLPVVGRYMPLRTPYASYEYTVGDKGYKGEKTSGPCVSWVRVFTYTPPEIDEKASMRELDDALKTSDPSQLAANVKTAMNKAVQLVEHPKYRPVKVRYNPLKPDESVLDPDVLQSGKSQMLTAMLLLVVGGAGLMGMIVHEKVTAPVPDDPTLSLDAALAAAKRRGRR